MRPVVTAIDSVSGECRTGVGTYVVVNRDGWILTAWHIKLAIDSLEAQVEAVKAHRAEQAAISARSMSGGARRQALKQLGTLNPDAAVHYAVWWNVPGVRLVEAYGIEVADIMLGRLEPFDPDSIEAYPSFKDPATPIEQGRSLCRLGFPFNNLRVSYDPGSDKFDFSNANVPGFAIEGILTREVNAGMNPAGFPNMLLETSSPGLMGQSGGPIVDVNGTVWAIQSKTMHLPLGFDPEVPDPKNPKGSKRREHQFLNVGWGTHPATIVGLLREKGIAHTLSQ